MSNETPPLFGKTKFLEGQIDEFLDQVAEGAIFLQIGVTAYLENAEVTEISQEKLQQILEVKERANNLRRSIGTLLYTEMLIPDARGDVLRLIGELYELLDKIGNNFETLLIEQPKSSGDDYRQGFEELIAIATKSVQMIVVAARAFFRNPTVVRDHIHEVRVYESEADKVALRLKKKIFGSDLPYEIKAQLRDAVNAIDELADKAELIGDHLSIFAIKRAL
jgi:predicted phosphate transport protein (TIGR00153 family)